MAEIYEAIDRSNRIINADVTFPTAVKAEGDNIKGEALFLRGLAYFDLVRIFGQHYTFTANADHPGVPIVTSFDPSAKPSRNTVNEVYQQVISDMTTSLSLLTIDPGTSGRVSANVAKALLSRVYLYMEDWVNAEKYASEVINSGDYALLDDQAFPSAFSGGESSESIFEIVMTQTDNNGSDALGGMYNSTGYGDYLPSLDLYDRMSATDARKQLFVTDNNLGALYGTIRVAKYPSSVGLNNTYVIRYAEMFLNRAEANYHIGGKETAVQNDITTLRQMRDPNAAAVTATGQALLDEVLLERRLELCFEGHRLWDLMRYKQGVDRTRSADCTSPVCTVAYPNDRFIMAIPVEEININLNMTQNTGY